MGVDGLSIGEQARRVDSAAFAFIRKYTYENTEEEKEGEIGMSREGKAFEGDEFHCRAWNRRRFRCAPSFRGRSSREKRDL